MKRYLQKSTCERLSLFHSSMLNDKILKMHSDLFVCIVNVENKSQLSFKVYFAMKRCPIAAKIAGSIGIMPCCVFNDFF